MSAIRVGTWSALAALSVAQTVKVNDDTVKTRACQGEFASFPFCNTSLSIDARIDDLISRLQPGDIAPQLTARHQGGGNPGPTSNITNLGIPDYDWGLNCIHGVQSSCVEDSNGVVYCPTSFPNPINYGFSWNDTAFHMLGAVIANETRALWLAGAVEDSTWSGRPHIGLDVWSPNINIFRDPRWGRGQETPGEDPFLNGRYGMLHTQGLQEGADPRYYPTVVTLKHWDAYSLEDSDGFTRDNFNAIVSNFTLADTYWPAFKASIIQGGAMGVMCSYNAINGVPTCAMPINRQVMRDTWGFQGYITSDTGAVEDIWVPGQHEYRKSGPEGACAAIRDGTTDVCSGDTYHNDLLKGVAQGNCSIDDVNLALRHTFNVRFRLGLFDPIEDQPYWNMGLDAIGTPAAKEAQWIATLEGQVLLKNDGNTLPLPLGKNIAVIGPHAQADVAMAGNYLGQLCPDNSNSCIDTPLKVITQMNAAGKVTYAAGCQLTKNDTSGFAAAVAAAQASDIVIMFLGIDGSIEGEMEDRKDIDLPYIQHQLAATIAGVGKPTVIVLFNGGGVDISPELGNRGIGAVLEAGYPGVLGGHGVAATLFGQNDRLGGKLPYTLYPASYINMINMSEMEMDVGVGRTYRYYAGQVVKPFGFGMSYTTFMIENITTVLSTPEGPRAGLSMPAGKPAVLRTEPAGYGMRRVGEPAKPPAWGTTLSYTVNVTNIGSVTGDDVVQAFFMPEDVPGAKQGLEGLKDQPLPLLMQLWGYQRVHLTPGQSQIITFTADASTFRMTHRATGDIMSLPGTYKVRITNGLDVTLDNVVVLEGEQSVVEPFPGRSLN